MVGIKSMIKPKTQTELKEKALQMKYEGYSVAETANILLTPKSTVWDWFNDRKRNNEYPISYKNENLTDQRASFDKKNFDIEDFLSQLAPINLKPTKRSLSKKELNDYVVVLNDLHFPMHCQKSIDIALEVISELKPRSVIINGDSLDMLAISRYPKDIRKQFSLLDERIAYHEFLYALDEASSGAEIIEVHGNHSGDSTFGRWWRYLSERIGELACLPEMKYNLSYENVFLGDFKNRIGMADYVELNGDLVVLHGDVVRKHGGFSARGTLEKYYQSCIMGHTHRVGFTAQRIPSIGKRKDKQLYAYETGCLCKLSALYASAPNWQNAFGIVSLGENNSFGLETVMINDGVANVSTLGKTIFA
jgi:predicted phosphodiesterase